MSYLPQLRDSLVKAAERQAMAPVAGPARAPRRQRGFGGLALIGASLGALAVAGVVLMLIGHRSPHAPVSAESSYGSRAVALEAAGQLLAAFKPPAGAIKAEKDPSRPRTLGWVDGGLPVPSAVDLSRFYLLRGDPESVMAKIDPERSLGPSFIPVDAGPFWGAYGTSGSSSGSSASTTLSLRGIGSLARQLVIQTARAGDGLVAMRVDAQTWWTVLRPASERIPANARAIVIEKLGHVPAATARLHGPSRLVKPSDVGRTIAFLNAVGVRQHAYDSRYCSTSSGFRLRLTFIGTGQHPDPIAVIDPTCGEVALSLRGHPEPTLVLGSPTGQIDPLRAMQLIELLIGAPQTRTWAQLMAEAKRDASTGGSARTTTSASAQATPGR